jgi:signal transduction histidine kinase
MSDRSTPRPISLLANLFGRMGALFIVVIVLVGLFAFFSARRQVNEVYDDQLVVGANVLRALMSEELAEAAKPGAQAGAMEIDDSSLLSREDRRAFNSYAEWRMFRVWQHQRVVLRSNTGPPASSPQPEGFTTLKGPHAKWRIYALHVPDTDVVVEVGERKDIRSVLVRRIALGVAAPLLLLIPATGLLIWLALNGGLRALQVLLAEIGSRSMRDLSTLPLSPWPRDLHPLVLAINRLFDRIDRSLRQERRFLDNAAHQLRTPLAAVKLQAQMVAREGDSEQRQLLTAQLVAGVDRASALIDSLLTLARLEAQTARETAASGDLRIEAMAALADIAPLAVRRQIELSFEGEGEMPAGDPTLLRLVAANLLENAIHHSPNGAHIDMRVWTADGRHHLTVTDDGPGLTPDERDQVLKRFHRGRNAGPQGSGLGLSIVTEALRLLGGELQLLEREDGLSGLRACVHLTDDRA